MIAEMVKKNNYVLYATTWSIEVLGLSYKRTLDVVDTRSSQLLTPMTSVFKMKCFGFFKKILLIYT